jgi:hypothetical protein
VAVTAGMDMYAATYPEPPKKNAAKTPTTMVISAYTFPLEKLLTL